MWLSEICSTAIQKQSLGPFSSCCDCTIQPRNKLQSSVRVSVNNRPDSGERNPSATLSDQPFVGSQTLCTAAIGRIRAFSCSSIYALEEGSEQSIDLLPRRSTTRDHLSLVSSLFHFLQKRWTKSSASFNAEHNVIKSSPNQCRPPLDSRSNMEEQRTSLLLLSATQKQALPTLDLSRTMFNLN